MLSMELQKIDDCPVCAAKGRKLDIAAKYYLEPFGTFLEQSYALCDDCEFVYCTNPLPDATLDEYYLQSKRYYEPQQRIGDLQHAEGQATFALRYANLPADFKLLEVGPFRDYFLSTMLAKAGGKGYFSELNVAAVERLLAQGYTRVDWAADEKFELIALRHVMEHIVDLRGFMTFLGTKLAADGTIFIEVPDLTHCELTYVDDLQFEHVNYFTQKSLLALAKNTGFHAVGMESARVPGSATSSNQVLRVCLRKLPASQRKDLAVHLARSFAFVDQVKALLAKHDKVAFYGAGTFTQLLLSYLDESQRPLLIVDGDPQKHGHPLMGVSVSDPSVLLPAAYDIVFVTALGPEEIVVARLKGLGFADSQIVRLSSMLWPEGH